MAAAATLVVGSCCGLGLFALGQLRPEWWATFVDRNHFDFLLQGVALLLFCSLVMLGVSWAAPHQHTDESRSLVWKSVWEPLQSPGWPGLANYRVIAGLLVALLTAIYVILQ